MPPGAAHRQLAAGVGAGAGPGPPRLPSSFRTIRQVLDEVVPPGSRVSLIGMVKDCRLPISTNGTGK